MADYGLRTRPSTTRSVDSISRFKPSFLAGATKPSRPRRGNRSDDKQQTGGASPAKREIDMGKILTESWLLEKNNLERLEIQELAPDFNEPTRQVELLERTATELNKIHQRVTKTLLDFEQTNNSDDVLKLIDEDDDEVQLTAGFDRKSIMEESKGKVKVLLVDYGKLGLKRETVLSALKEWFEEMENDNLGDLTTDTLDDDEYIKNFGEKTINTLLTSAHAAKDRLIDIHYDLVEFCQNQVKALAAAAAAAQDARSNDQARELLDKATKEMEEMAEKAKELETKLFSNDKLLARKDEELKFFKMTDNSKLSDLQNQLYQFQQMSQEREAALNKELVKTKLALEKAQQQLEVWVNEMQANGFVAGAGAAAGGPGATDDEQLDTANMDADDWMELHLKDKAQRRQLESTARRLQEEMKAQATMQQKELGVMQAQQLEEFESRLQKMRIEHRAALDSAESAQQLALRRREQEVQDRMDDEIAKKFEGLGSGGSGASGGDKESKKMWDALRKTYEERLAYYKENAALELQRARQDYEAKLLQANMDVERRQELLGETHQAEIERTKQEGAAELQRELALLKEQHEQALLAEQLASHQNVTKIKRTLGKELAGLQQEVQRREQLVRDIMAKVELLNSMVSRTDDDSAGGSDKSSGGAAGGGALGGGGSREEEFKKLRAEFLLEKKKAVQVALHQAALEKDAAVMALQQRQQEELGALVDERTRQVLDENAREMEYKEEQLKELAREMALMRDEIEHLNAELDKEDEVREGLFRKSQEDQQQMHDKYERIIGELQQQLQDLKSGDARNTPRASSPKDSSRPGSASRDGGEQPSDGQPAAAPPAAFELVEGDQEASSGAPGSSGGPGTDGSGSGDLGAQVRRLEQRVNELQNENDFLRSQAMRRPSGQVGATSDRRPSATRPPNSSGSTTATPRTAGTGQQQLLNPASAAANPMHRKAVQLQTLLVQLQPVSDAQPQPMRSVLEHIAQLLKACTPQQLEQVQALLPAQYQQSQLQLKALLELLEPLDPAQLLQLQLTVTGGTGDGSSSSTDPQEVAAEPATPELPPQRQHLVLQLKQMLSQPPPRSPAAGQSRSDGQSAAAAAGADGPEPVLRELLELLQSMSAPQLEALQTALHQERQQQRQLQMQRSESAFSVSSVASVAADPLPADPPSSSQDAAIAPADGSAVQSAAVQLLQSDPESAALLQRLLIIVRSIAGSAADQGSSPAPVVPPLGAGNVGGGFKSGGATPIGLRSPGRPAAAAASSDRDAEIAQIQLSLRLAEAKVTQLMAENEFLKMFQQPGDGTNRSGGGSRTPKTRPASGPNSQRGDRPPALGPDGKPAAPGSIDELKAELEQAQEEVADLVEQRSMLEKQLDLLVSNQAKSREKESEARDLAARLQVQLNASQLELETKQQMWQTALKETKERQARITMLEDQLLSTQQVLDSLDAKRQELERLVATQEQRLGQVSSRPVQLEERIEQLERAKRDASAAFDSERDMLVKQIQKVESEYEQARQTHQQALELLSSRYDTKLEEMRREHDGFMLELQANYEKRLKGLTDALTASLNDTELIERLRRANEEQISDSKLINDRELQRVKQRLEEIENSHRDSLFDIVTTDRNEVKRMQQFVERLNKQFATLLEEEKALIPDEQQEHVQLLDTIRLELEQLLSEQEHKMQNERPPTGSAGAGGEEVRHLRELVDWEIQVVNAMHRAMANVLRHQRTTFTTALREKGEQLERLHDDTFGKSKELVDLKQRILDSDKTIAELRRQLAQIQYSEQIGLSEVRAQLDERQQVLDAFRQKQLDSEQLMREAEGRQHEADEKMRQFSQTAAMQNAVIARLRQLLEQQQQQQQPLLGTGGGGGGGGGGNRGPVDADKMLQRIRAQLATGELGVPGSSGPNGSSGKLGLPENPDEAALLLGNAAFGGSMMDPTGPTQKGMRQSGSNNELQMMMYGRQQSLMQKSGSGSNLLTGGVGGDGSSMPVPLDDVLRAIGYRKMADRLVPGLPPAPDLSNFPLLKQLLHNRGRLLRPRPKPAQVRPPPTGLEGIIKAIQLAPPSRGLPAVRTAWEEVKRQPAMSPDEQQRRQLTDQLLRNDHQLRRQLVATTFASLGERLKVRSLHATMPAAHRTAPAPGSSSAGPASSAAGTTPMSRALERMARRHAESLAKWEAKRQDLLAERSRNWERTLSALSDVAIMLKRPQSISEGPPSTSLGGTGYLADDGGLRTIAAAAATQQQARPASAPHVDVGRFLATFQDVQREVLPGPTAPYDLRGLLSHSGHERPRDVLADSPAALQPPPRAHVAQAKPMRALIDPGGDQAANSNVPSSYDLVLRWPGIEGQRARVFPKGADGTSSSSSSSLLAASGGGGGGSNVVSARGGPRGGGSSKGPSPAVVAAVAAPPVKLPAISGSPRSATLRDSNNSNAHGSNTGGRSELTDSKVAPLPPVLSPGRDGSHGH